MAQRGGFMNWQTMHHASSTGSRYSLTILADTRCWSAHQHQDAIFQGVFSWSLTTKSEQSGGGEQRQANKFSLKCPNPGLVDFVIQSIKKKLKTPHKPMFNSHRQIDSMYLSVVSSKKRQKNDAIPLQSSVVHLLSTSWGLKQSAFELRPIWRGAWALSHSFQGQIEGIPNEKAYNKRNIIVKRISRWWSRLKVVN